MTGIVNLMGGNAAHVAREINEEPTRKKPNLTQPKMHNYMSGKFFILSGDEAKAIADYCQLPRKHKAMCVKILQGTAPFFDRQPLIDLKPQDVDSRRGTLKKLRENTGLMKKDFKKLMDIDEKQIEHFERIGVWRAKGKNILDVALILCDRDNGASQKDIDFFIEVFSHTPEQLVERYASTPAPNAIDTPAPTPTTVLQPNEIVSDITADSTSGIVKENRWRRRLDGIFQPNEVDTLASAHPDLLAGNQLPRGSTAKIMDTLDIRGARRLMLTQRLIQKGLVVQPSRAIADSGGDD